MKKLRILLSIVCIALSSITLSVQADTRFTPSINFPGDLSIGGSLIHTGDNISPEPVTATCQDNSAACTATLSCTMSAATSTIIGGYGFYIVPSKGKKYGICGMATQICNPNSGTCTITSAANFTGEPGCDQPAWSQQIVVLIGSCVDPKNMG